MTREQINAMLAQWLGWTAASFFWMTIEGESKYSGYTTDPTSSNYFNPYHRIDHAWLLVERMQVVGTYAQKIKIDRWFRDHLDPKLKASDAARAICEAVIEICELALTPAAPPPSR